MPVYVYKCESGHEWERVERMCYGTAVLCPECEREMHRVPQRVAVTWGGLKPSGGELAGPIQEHLANVDRNRDRFNARHEWHESQEDASG